MAEELLEPLKAFPGSQQISDPRQVKEYAHIVKQFPYYRKTARTCDLLTTLSYYFIENIICLAAGSVCSQAREVCTRLRQAGCGLARLERELQGRKDSCRVARIAKQFSQNRELRTCCIKFILSKVGEEGSLNFGISAADFTDPDISMLLAQKLGMGLVYFKNLSEARLQSRRAYSGLFLWRGQSAIVYPRFSGGQQVPVASFLEQSWRVVSDQIQLTTPVHKIMTGSNPQYSETPKELFPATPARPAKKDAVVQVALLPLPVPLPRKESSTQTTQGQSLLYCTSRPRVRSQQMVDRYSKKGYEQTTVDWQLQSAQLFSGLDRPRRTSPGSSSGQFQKRTKYVPWWHSSCRPI